MFGSGGSAGNVSVTVSPTATSLQADQQTQLTATVIGTNNTAVTWTDSGGTVTSGGQYAAPSSAVTYRVKATSVADSSKSASAVVTVSQPTQVSISVSPSTASLQTGGQQQFTATVSGTTNTAVTWTASGGTVTSGGQYTAPSSAGTYTVKATSVADSSKSASAVVTVSQPTQVSISVSPSTASLQTGGQQQFTAYVSGTSNTAVTWSASSGTVTNSGLYVAPRAAGTYTVTAVSAADTTKSASATVSVSAPQAISVSISPTTVAMPQKWQQQFAATVSGSSNTAVTWAVTQGTGTITQSGLYTAPKTVETDTVVATSQADSTKSASASITVVAPHSVALSWSPSSSGISYYNVYRGTVSGGPYSLLTTGVISTLYTDPNVQSGSTYYYVTTAVDSSRSESVYSNEAQVVIPMP
jgi:Bacterial Ig-like domain (group 2)